MADYYTLLTNAGIAYETACKAAGVPIKLAQISVGDGNGAVYNPDANAKALKREVWRGPLNALFQDEKNPSWLLAEVTIPSDVGGWYVREAGLWTDTGILYAVVKYPESYKPVLATSGSGKEFYIRAIFETSNASAVTLLIDDTVVKATRAWVVGYVADELSKLDGKQSVRVATTANIELSGAQQVDGVAVVMGDRVGVIRQNAEKDNGIYIVTNGPWIRAVDADSSQKVTPGLSFFAEEGTANAGSVWQLVTKAPVVLGTTALVFEMAVGRTGIPPGTYRSLTVDKYGRVTGGANPTTLEGSGITDGVSKYAPHVIGAISELQGCQYFSGILPKTVDSPAANVAGVHIEFANPQYSLDIFSEVNNPSGYLAFRNNGPSSLGLGVVHAIYHEGNFSPTSKISGNTCPAAGFAGGDNTVPYMMHADGTVVALATAGASFGVGQTRKVFAVGTERVAGTTYYNTTPRPIWIYLESSSSNTLYGAGALKVGGSTMNFPSSWYTTPTSGGGGISAIVLPGESYAASAATLWVEVR